MIGIKSKYTDSELKKLYGGMIILIDSREKNNKHIVDWFTDYNISWKNQKLDFGDYSFALEANTELGIVEYISFEKEISIERKASAEEISNNFTKGRERFKKEYTRGNNKLRLLIEDSSYADISKGNYKSELSPKSFLASLHSFQEEFNAPFFFVNKDYSALYIYNTFKYFLRDKYK